MLTRLIVLVVGMAIFTAVAHADDTFTVGSVTFSIPQGWSQIDQADDHLTFGAHNGQQRATVSVLHCGKSPSFDDFKALCDHRYDTERNGIKDLVLIPKDPAPLNDDGKFTMTFSGEENPTTRVFSGLLWIKGTDLITVYVEGINVSAEKNSESFKAFVNSLK
jgi:hypothetical protein